jgi:hypothetical protein
MHFTNILYKTKSSVHKICKQQQCLPLVERVYCRKIMVQLNNLNTPVLVIHQVLQTKITHL